MYSHGVSVKMFLAARKRMMAKCSLKARHLIVSHNENLAINNPSLVQQLQNINNDPGALQLPALTFLVCWLFVLILVSPGKDKSHYIFMKMSHVGRRGSSINMGSLILSGKLIFPSWHMQLLPYILSHVYIQTNHVHTIKSRLLKFA